MLTYTKPQFEEILPREFDIIQWTDGEIIYDVLTEDEIISARIWSCLKTSQSEANNIYLFDPWKYIFIIFWDNKRDQRIGQRRYMSRSQFPDMIALKKELRKKISKFNPPKKRKPPKTNWKYVEHVLRTACETYPFMRTRFAVSLADQLQEKGYLSRKQMAYVIGDHETPGGWKTIEKQIKQRDPDFVRNWENRQRADDNPYNVVYHMNATGETQQYEPPEGMEPLQPSDSSRTWRDVPNIEMPTRTALERGLSHLNGRVEGTNRQSVSETTIAVDEEPYTRNDFEINGRRTSGSFAFGSGISGEWNQDEFRTVHLRLTGPNGNRRDFYLVSVEADEGINIELWVRECVRAFEYEIARIDQQTNRVPNDNETAMLEGRWRQQIHELNRENLSERRRQQPLDPMFCRLRDETINLNVYRGIRFVGDFMASIERHDETLSLRFNKDDVSRAYYMFVGNLRNREDLNDWIFRTAREFANTYNDIQRENRRTTVRVPTLSARGPALDEWEFVPNPETMESIDWAHIAQHNMERSGNFATCTGDDDCPICQARRRLGLENEGGQENGNS
jgi:hypothetical protein